MLIFTLSTTSVYSAPQRYYADTRLVSRVYYVTTKVRCSQAIIS